MNQNLDFAAIEALQMDLARSGYTGSAEELRLSIQRASTSHEERRFWLMMGLPSSDATAHPLRPWLANLVRHFGDATYRAGDLAGEGLVMLSRRVAASRPVVSATVTIRHLCAGRSKLEVFVRYYEAGRNDFRRSQTFYLPLPETMR